MEKSQDSLSFLAKDFGWDWRCEWRCDWRWFAGGLALIDSELPSNSRAIGQYKEILRRNRCYLSSCQNNVFECLGRNANGTSSGCAFTRCITLIKYPNAKSPNGTFNS